MNWIDQINKIVSFKPPYISNLKPSEWAEQNRVMTSDVSAFPGKFSYDRTPYLREVVDCLSSENPARQIAVMKGAQIGFALDVDTDIPTPHGFKKMGELREGDIVYTEKGLHTKVTKATDVMNDHKCYKVYFTDGSEIIADADHLWDVIDLKGVKRTLNTEYMSSRFKKTSKVGKSRNRYGIINSAPVFNEASELPIDPYLLGLWLGDGHTNSNRISGDIDDLMSYQGTLFCKGIKSTIKYYPNNQTNNSYLRLKDVFNTWKGGYNIYGNKHIPEQYFVASFDQRLELLQGLIDTDGHIMKDGKVEFYNTNKHLIDSVRTLVSSLGYKVTIRVRDNKDVYTKIHPTKRYKMKPLFVLNFMGYSEVPVSKLQRKLSRLRPISEIRKDIRKRWISNIIEIDSVPVKCISVDSPTKLFLASRSYIPTHNSTGVIENGFGWIIANNPGNVLLSARDEGLVKKMVDTKIDQMIDSTGLREYIRPNIIRKKNQRTGDTSMSKEFPGGSMTAFSMQTPARLRQIAAQFGFLDDFEAAPNDKDAGSARSLFDTRFKSFGAKKKVFYISTPEVKQTSNIEPVYLEGDQRKYKVPCPCCGDFIELKWSFKTDSGSKAGITWKLDGNGHIIESSVGYTCQSCGDFFDESGKQELLTKGHWEATAKPIAEGVRSYQISTLYAPVGMDNWTDCVREFIKCFPENGPTDIPAYKTFINTCLGETWEAQGEKPQSKGISLNSRDYGIGIIPLQKSRDDGNGDIVMLTCGSDMNGKEDDARLDYEVTAWSESGASYSVEHGSIGTFIPRENTRKTKVDRERWSYYKGAKNSVWPKFQEIINNSFATDSGETMNITVTGLDTGYYTLLAYDFLDTCTGLVLGLKGLGADKFRSDEKDTPTFRAAKERDGLFLVEVNQIKDFLAECMKLRWQEGDGDQPSNFMNFPQPGNGLYMDKNFFHHFESEHKVLDPKAKSGNGTMWRKVKTSSQNHMWDCRIYNIVLKDILTHMLCKEMKEKVSWANYCELIK